ncbi:glycosyl hydrolase 53 family protein [Polaribacter porphyrae]|uniref:Arabinogalactan endo-beta-1,4-galactanase n=1 Tax=Polaribacter porphyrae TaxID=1137780 RepID=A0A2S7WKF5_9FLAO|nr:glycosyl hydrolase 53 family protein [Polaribacter porphyrae]PQJ78079.1 hypothetical protein BTO18_02225 [Polaribacter porphyrae]
MQKNYSNSILFKSPNNTIIVIVIIVVFNITAKAQIAKGADVGWLSYFENNLGITYLNDDGEQQDALKILQNHDMNAIRLRAFVNPTEDNIGEVNTAGVVKNAVRAKNLGLDVMITIHYSDTWADPGSQHKPASWENLNFEQLSQAVYDYTYQLMDALLNAGVTPKWVQVGNETDPGFLWEEGRLTSSNSFANMNNFVTLSNKGYDAIKDRSPTTKVITHIADGNNTTFLTGFFDEFYAKGGKNDIIGVSYYPRWHKGTIQSVVNNLNLLVNQFTKDVMICEIGDLENSQSSTYNMLVDAIDLVEAIPNNRGLGVFYWEPISHSSINGYEQGLAIPIADKQYKFSWVLDAFLDNAEKCVATKITPYIKINDENWQQTSNIIARVGNTIQFNPEPVAGSNWAWRGPNGFSANSRKITLSKIQKNTAGDYTVTYTPDNNGCQVSQTFSLQIYEVGEIIIENPGFETGQISPWLGEGNYGIDTDLINSGVYSGWFGGGNSELYQTITGLLPNTTYQFLSYIRSTSGDNGVVTTGVRDFGNITTSIDVGITGNFGNDFELAEIKFTTGSTNTSATIFASTTKSNTWGKIDDVKVIELNALSNDKNNHQKELFKIYPNPTSNNLTIKPLNFSNNLYITIYDLNGKKVFNKQQNITKNNTFSVSVSNLAKGIYFIQLKDTLAISTKRLIIK